MSIILKPRKSGLTEVFENSNYYNTNFNQWDGILKKDTLVDRVPIERLESIYNELHQEESPFKLILAVSIKNGLSECERIEKLFNN